MDDLKKARRELLKHIINQYYAEEMLVSLLQNNYTESEICTELSKMIKKIEVNLKKC